MVLEHPSLRKVSKKRFKAILEAHCLIIEQSVAQAISGYDPGTSNQKTRVMLRCYLHGSRNLMMYDYSSISLSTSFIPQSHDQFLSFNAPLIGIVILMILNATHALMFQHFVIWHEYLVHQVLFV